MQDPSLYHQQMNLNSQFPGHEHLKCPRCDSTNTKFCYYNNYNLSQPRHYCKSCRRHWTKGGTLRNIPVGGGSRKCSKSGSSSSRRNPSPNSSLSSPSDANQKVPKSETSIGYKPIDRNHQLFDTSGTLGSLLPESGKLWSLFEGANARGFARTPNLSLQPCSDPNLIPDPVVEFQGDIDTGCFLGVENRGDSSRWASNNGWPDFAI